MSDYKMTGTSFEELFNVYEELSDGENFKLIITEMNYHEILEHFKSELNKAFKKYSTFRSELMRLADVEDNSQKQFKENIINDFETRINDLFSIKSSSKDSTFSAFERFYQRRMPFRDNKHEFKDALIWETVYEYAKFNPDEKIYFVSKNHKDFAIETEKGEYELHNHLDSLNGRIKYILGINEFLIEIDHLKIHHFDFNEESEVLENIRLDLLLQYIHNPLFYVEMHDFFSNHTFMSDYFEGWGSDYSIMDIYELEIPDRDHVLETNDIFLIPVHFIAEIVYSVEINNPVYEQWAGDEEFIQSESTEEQFGFECLVKYDPKEKKIIDIEEINMIFL